MLVLTRKEGEGIVIGDDIRVYVVEMKNGSIRLGIDAPKERTIYRQEVYDRISRQNKEAVEWNLSDLQSLSDRLSHKEEPT